MSPSVDDRVHLVTRNLQEVLGQSRLEEIMHERPLKIYWGTATTGKPHIAYFVPVCKIADFLHAGCEVTILFADMHAYLDNMKAPWELLKLRAEYYEKIIKAMLRSIGIDLTKLKFVKGTEYQLSREYTLDVYRMASIVTQHDAKKAGAEVVKQVESPLLSGLLYPCLQALDEQYLGVDAQFGGVDQRKIFTFAEKHLPMLGYEKRIHLMNPMVPGLAGSKMSASEDSSKIDLLDGPDAVKRKLKKAFCEPGNVENNWVLSFAKHVVFPTLQFGNRSSSYKVQRSEADGGTVEYTSYEDLERDFANLRLHPSDLKASMTDYVNHLLEPILQEFKSPDLQALVKQAYSAVQKTESAPSTKLNGEPHVDPRIFDLCVGRIVSTEKHPRADSLLVHRVEVDPEAVRTVCSGLLPYLNTSEWPRNSSCVVLRNIKPVNMRGIESHGLILAMYKDKPEKVGSLLRPNEGSEVGDRVWIDGFERPGESVEAINKKQWDKLQSLFSVDQEGTVSWNGCPMRTSSGNITCNVVGGVVR